MIPLIETIAMSAGFLVLCFIVGLIYLVIRRFRTLSLIYLLTSAIVLAHVLLIFIMIFVPGVLPNFLVQYGAFWVKVFI